MVDCQCPKMQGLVCPQLELRGQWAIAVRRQKSHIRATAAGIGGEQWSASQARLVGLGLSKEEADKALGKASGYAKSPYWGENKAKCVPAPSSVSATLDFLQLELGLSQAEASDVLRKFPELLGCSLETEVKPNVAVLDETWGISGGTLKSLVLRKPHVLGYNVDCKGDCQAECTRCWARF